MYTNYLKLQFLPVPDPQKTAIDAAKVLLITSDQQLDQLGVEKSVVQQIEKLVLEKKTQILTTLAEVQYFFVVLGATHTEAIRLAGASLFAALNKHQTEAASIQGLEVLCSTQGYAFLEGLLLSSYDFDKYKSTQPAHSLQVYLPEKIFKHHSFQELYRIMQAISLTKTLVNEPPNIMNALRFSEVATEAGQKFGFETKVMHQNSIEQLKMGGLLAVNKGSSTPPTFTVIHYQPEQAVNKKPLVLVGKGIMFDTGGYSLKGKEAMLSMKCDMAGGAAVLGTIAAIAANQLPYHVIGLVPSTDNKISANALVVDDVITMMDGTTVEVQNTDAEGRLVLADALYYAQSLDPELVIDIATLTGASAAITGALGMAVLGNAQQEIATLQLIGDHVHERLVQLPLWEEYRELLASNIADLSNMGGPVGGVSTSSLFLEHFTNYPWIHLDIAGAAFVKEARGYRQKGATAVPVRLLYEFVKKKCDETRTDIS